MRRAMVSVQGKPVGYLEEHDRRRYRFAYLPRYAGLPVSLTMPVRDEPYEFDDFPPFFDGLLPEGVMLDALLRSAKLDRGDYFGQLLAVGGDTVGAVTVVPADDVDEPDEQDR